METIINQFPEYQPNQVLTEASLNATSDFLEQQERLTRFGLTKTGIIENLQFRIVGDAIHIEEGFGVTKDGYFLAHNYKNGPVVYTHAKSYKLNVQHILGTKQYSQNTIEFYELLTTAQAKEDTDAITLTDLIVQKFKLILYLEITKIQQDQCSTTSCDTSGTLRTYRVVPLITLEDEKGIISKINSEPKPKNRLKLKRLSNLHHLLKNQEPKNYLETIKGEYARVNYQNTNALIEKIYQILSSDYPKSFGENFQSFNIDNMEAAVALLELMLTTYIPTVNHRDFPYNYGYVAQKSPKSNIPKATTNFLRLTQNLRVNNFLKPNKKVHANAQIYYQAYYEFTHNLEQAINEFVLMYNEFADHYFSEYESRLDKILVLGYSIQKTSDPYRYFAIENFSNAIFREAKENLFRHFNRIWILIEKFYQGFAQLSHKTEIKLIPSRSGNYNLEDTAIPYYYQQDLELDTAWMVTHNKGMKTDIYQYRDLKAPYSHFAYNISSYNFIRVEGVIGRLIPKLRTFFPPRFDFTNIKFEDLTNKDFLIKDLTKNLMIEANSLVNIKFQKEMTKQIADRAIVNLKEDLTKDLVENHKLDSKVIKNLVDQVSVDLTNKLDVDKVATKSELILSDLDKQIDMFNIPLRYDIMSIEELEKNGALKYLEPAMGTQIGGTIIFLTNPDDNGDRIIASFMKYF
jgi:hypothetical protein